MNGFLGKTSYAAAVLSLGEHNVYRYLRQAVAIEGAPEESLLARQNDRLSVLLQLVRSSNQYYRPFLTQGDPKPDALAILGTLPVLERRVLQENPTCLLSEGFRGRTITKSTGGSTGAPVRIVKDADGVAKEMAGTWAALRRYGVGIGDRSVRFWGTPLTKRRAVRFWLADLAMNRLRFSAFAIGPGDFAGYWRRAVRFQPAWLYGYATVIHMFAEWLESEGLDGSRLRLRAIVLTSEPLNGRQRNQITRVFGAPVYDEYGCGEVGAIGYGCSLNKLHVVTDNVIVECVDERDQPASEGEVGHLLVTDLTNRAMPLLRYRVGDLGALGRGCACGLTSPFIDGIRGRIRDVVHTPAGRRIHGQKIDYLMSHLHQEVGEFHRYQLVQFRANAVRVLLVADPCISDETKRRIAQYVSDGLDGINVEVRCVDRIQRTPSGKVQLVRNDWLLGFEDVHE